MAQSHSQYYHTWWCPTQDQSWKHAVFDDFKLYGPNSRKLNIFPYFVRFTFLWSWLHKLQSKLYWCYLLWFLVLPLGLNLVISWEYFHVAVFSTIPFGSSKWLQNLSRWQHKMIFQIFYINHYWTKWAHCESKVFGLLHIL